EDGAVNGRLTTTLNFQYQHDVQKTPGRYTFQVSIDGIPWKASFIITETNQAQTIQGYVFDDVNSPIVGARVQLLDKWGSNYGYAYADVAGHYLFNVANPGEYYLIPTSRDYAYDKSKIVVESLSAGQNLNVDLFMVPGTSGILGWVKDSSTSEIITSGNYVRAENDQYIAEAYDLSHIISTTDNVFKYKFNVPPGVYDLYVDTFNSRGGFTQGYLAVECPVAQTPPALPDLFLGKATGMACGNVYDQSLMGVAGVVIMARSDSAVSQFATAVTDANGDYCIGLNSSGSWQISLNEKANQAAGYVGNYVDGVTATTGPFDGNDLSITSIDAWVSGTVLEDGLGPVAGVSVELTNVTTGALVRGETAFDGTYRLGAFAGSWSVKISPETLGYEPVASAPVSLTTGQTTPQDFNVSMQPPVQPVNTIVVTK
ncbi:MAG: carboxypeptidase regulatory-like domain-containing protein, partial [Desulfuromonadales bacterium]|nr:carboxypeptidase regulatory-like domain-containing protein [Desulfuromonadales bacterium]